MAVDKSLITRLKRYSAHAIGHALDDDFAEAVHDAAEMIDSLVDDLQEALDEIDRLRNAKTFYSFENDRMHTTLVSCRNELCLKCGQYKLDNCGECRWKL